MLGTDPTEFTNGENPYLPSADITLKAIASDVGFSSMTTFYKMFQTNVGMSPKEYREKALHLSSGTDEAD